MSDGDIIRDKLLWFAKPYKQICEGKASPQECAWDVMKAFLRDLKHKGDDPIRVLQLMGEEIDKSIFSVRIEGNWANLSRNIYIVVRQSNLSHYNKEYLLRASQKFLKKLRDNHQNNNNNLKESLIAEYFKQVLQLDFRDRIPLVNEHHAGIDNLSLQQRQQHIEEIISKIDSEIPKLAKKANTEGSVQKLRRPRRQNIQPIDWDEEL